MKYIYKIIARPDLANTGQWHDSYHGVARPLTISHDLAFRAELESGLRDDPLVSEPAMAQLSYLPTVTREAFTCNARITTMIEDGSLFAQAGLSGAPLSVQTDRIMLCGGMAMIKDIAHLLDARGFIEGSNAKPGDYVIERAFVG